jgi:DNA-binding IclR family transcriptional regulator
MMDELHDQTGVAVMLGSMVGTSLKHIHTVGSLPEALACGAERHPLHSPFGHVILSTMFSRDIRLLVHRLNAESPLEEQVRYPDLQVRVDEVSKKRSAMGEVAPGWSGIAVLLPQGMGEEQLAIGMVGATAEIEARAEELLRALRQAISAHVGPRVASENEVPYPLKRQGGEKV